MMPFKTMGSLDRVSRYNYRNGMFYVITILLLLSACGEKNTLQFGEIRGFVTDTSGEPVNNLSVHIKHHLIPGGFVESSGSGQVRFEFNVTEKGDFLIELFRYASNKPLAVLFEGELPQGRHSIGIADSLLSNGAFRYSINATSQQSTRYFFVNKPDTALPTTVPITETDTEGKFIIDTRSLPLGEILQGPDINNVQVGDSLRLILTEQDSVLSTKSIQVKRNGSVSADFEIKD